MEWNSMLVENPDLADTRTALERFNEIAAECDGELDIETPLERLRFFCSLAMNNGTDWIDVEPFFDALEKQIEGLS